MKRTFGTVADCSDCRVLLTIMSRAPCFTDEEAQIAKKLKEVANYAAHTDLTRFSNDFTKDVFKNIETLFEVIEEDTENYKRDLQQVKKYGLQALLQKRSGQMSTAIRRSLDRAYSTFEILQPSLRASIEASLRIQEENLANIEVKERNMKK